MTTSVPDDGQPWDPDSTGRDLLVDQQHLPFVLRLLGQEGRTVQSQDAVAGLTRITLDDDADIPAALANLRTTASKDFGWVPAIGRNRMIDVPVEGQPQDSAGEGAAHPVRSIGRRPESERGLGVRIGVVDTRVYANNWLYGAVLASPREMVLTAAGLDRDDNQRLDPQAGHATFVSGLVLRQAPGATVLVESPLNNSGRARTSDVVAAAVRLSEQKVDILNLSLGCHTGDNEPPYGFDQMLRDINPDMVIVAAAGNRRRVGGETGTYAPPRAFFPAAFGSVVAVGAVQWREHPDGTGTWVPAPFSNSGAWLDFAAPGVDLHSTFVDFKPKRRTRTNPAFHGWARWGGTSFAAAIVSGTIAATVTEQGLSARNAVAFLRTRQPRVKFDADTWVPVLTQERWPPAT
jgi:membrane-anchored mycosin MYCP